MHDRDKAQTPIGKPRDFFNLDFSYNSGVYPSLDSSYPHGLVPYNNTGNDSSTTTSGSYVLDPEEEIKEVIQPSNRCIVWAAAKNQSELLIGQKRTGEKNLQICGDDESLMRDSVVWFSWNEILIKHERSVKWLEITCFYQTSA